MLDKMNFIETENEKYPLMFTLNVMEKIQEEYGSINAWSNLVQKEGEPDIKALKFFITEAQYNTLHVMFLFLWFPLAIFVLIDIAIEKGFNK